MTLTSQSNPLDLIDGETFLGPIEKLGGARAFVCCHRLGVLERASTFQIRSNPGGAESMAADWCLDAGGPGSPADHAPGVGLAHRLVGQSACLPALAAAKQPAFAIVADARGLDVGVQLLGQFVVTGDDMLLAAFFAQAQLPAGAARGDPRIFRAALMRAKL